MLKISTFTLALFIPFIAHTSSALNTAATGMSAQEEHVNTISNNIANVNTTGYKRQRVEIEDLLYQTRREAGARSGADTQYAVGIQTGSGARVSAIKKQHSQGDPQITNNPFDLMVNGQGFFGVVMPNNQVRFTRDGAFSVDRNGVLVTRSGSPVFPTFTFPPSTKSVNIGEDGSVEAYINSEVEPQNMGQIPIFTFINPAGLKSMGGNLYRTTLSSGEPIQNIAGQNNAGIVMQGALESSNVSIMNEMTNLIRAQRAYEMNSKVMGIADQMLQTVNNIR
jgi:flagellar basal-body rod protein FlgG